MEPPALPTVRVGKGWLTAGTVVNGIGAYLFVSIGTRALGTDAYAPVAVVWTSWTLLAAAVTVPVQHLVVVRRAGGWRFVAGELAPTLIVLVAGLGLGLLVVGERLFTDPSPVHPAAVGLILGGSFVLGIRRGRQAAGGDFRGLGWSLGVEGVVRIVALAPVLLLGGGAEWVVVAMLTGFAGALVPAPPVPDVPTRGVRRDVVSALLFGSGNAMAVAVLAAGPVVLPLLGAEPSDVTAFFATVALLRAPYLLLTGVSPRVSDALLRLRAADASVVAPSVWASIVLGSATGLGLAAAVVGPWLVGLVFGADAVLAADVTGVLAAAHVLALATLVLSLVPVTVDRPQAVTRAWGPATVLWALLAITLPLPPVEAVAWATLSAEAVVTAVLLVELVGWSAGMPRQSLVDLLRGTRDRPGTRPTGSSER